MQFLDQATIVFFLFCMLTMMLNIFFLNVITRAVKVLTRTWVDQCIRM
jgi:hypothetical protein